MIKELKRLHALGFSLLWLKPRTKQPIEKNWTKSPNKSLEEFLKLYKTGMNVGVRLGSMSKINLKGGAFYLAALDCDIKSTEDKTHLKEFSEAIEELSVNDLPCVLSGRNNGSRHFYFLSTEPQKSFTLKKSKSLVKVKMPSQSPSRREIKELTKKELAAGIRLRPAWEISVMGEGRQCVLPPSIHPDTGFKYAFRTSLELENLKVREFSKNNAASQESHEVQIFDLNSVKIKRVDLLTSELPTPIVEMIESGEGVEDRSASLFKAVIEMIRHGFTNDEVLSVLSDPKNFLGQVAYDHTKSKDRKKAIDWLAKYTLDKAHNEAMLGDAFDSEVKIEKLDDDKATEQFLSLDIESDWTDSLEWTGMGANKKIKGSMVNIEKIFKNEIGLSDHALSYNEFSGGDFWTTDAPWGVQDGDALKDHHAVNFKLYCANKFKVEFATAKIEEFFLVESRRNSFHPVRDYLKDLEWDGVKRVNTWLESYLSAVGPKEYVRAVGRKFLCAMVGRIFCPGIKFDSVMILEGNQGMGKSTACSILASPWFSDSDLNLGDKDSVISIQGNWLIELGELSAMSKYDVNIMKHFISRAVDKIRPPFGKRLVDFPRQSVFVGTTNADAYLKDPTGNRRFWPVKLEGTIELERLREDRDQLLAEAVLMFESGEELYLETSKLQDVAREEQANRGDYYDELATELGEFLENNENLIESEGFTIGELFKVGPLEGVKNDRSGQIRVGQCLKELGYERRRNRKETHRAWRWYKKESPI